MLLLVAVLFGAHNKRICDLWPLPLKCSTKIRVLISCLEELEDNHINLYFSIFCFRFEGILFLTSRTGMFLTS